MKRCKAYTCKISGNKSKVKYLGQRLEIIKDLSWYIFTLKQRFGVTWWSDQGKLYKQCTSFFPELNTKAVQYIMLQYKPIKGKKLPKKPIKSGYYADSQSIEVIENSNTKLTNFWLKLHRKYFPLLGRNILKRIPDLKLIKLIQIFERNGELYCKLTTSEKISITNSGVATVGCDINYKRAVVSNNKFYDLKQLAHRKMEHKKNNSRKKNLTNYSRDFLHKVTTQIVKDFQQQGVDVLHLENLTHIRKSASKKLGTSKGKLLNYIINSFPFSMFQTFLEYKCLDANIKVIKINPAYTSQTCSHCGGRDSVRPRQQDFMCNTCGFKLDADLNGARNISM